MSYESLISRKQRTFNTMSYLQGPWIYGKANEAVESSKAGLTLLKRAVKRKERDHERREGGSSEGNDVPCVPNEEFIILVHEYLGETHLE